MTPPMRVRPARRIIAAASALLLSACAGERRMTPDALPALRVVLPASEAGILVDGCHGRDVRADSLWTPPDSVLRRLERRLAGHLESAWSADLGDPLEVYALQYVGFHRDGRRWVFVNGVDRGHLQMAVEWDSVGGASERVERVARRFREEAVSVCDGGEGFFRAEYDVEADRVSAFAFNGRA